MNAPLRAEPQSAHAEAAYLGRLGERVRAWRTEHGMTRRMLSAASGVSERYLAQLESGQGNMSVLLLRKVSRAMGLPVEQLVREEERPV
ncbi:MAG TPA: helix-turn-helix domain-containing protein, partial [Burkholderiales bacterium]|nr:helix-turn-helix domain-containing protein [Burkholderiales bacterium]